MTEPIPAFEGRPVDSTLVKVTGAIPLDDLNDTVLGVDDCVQMLSMFKVVAVHHQVDDKTGNLRRIQILKPIEMALQPIDPTDPGDDGIVRALPQAVSRFVSDDDDEEND